MSLDIDALLDADAERAGKVEALAGAATEGPWEAMDLDREINGETVTGHNKGWWWVWRTAAKPYYGGVLEMDKHHPECVVGTCAVADHNDGDQERTDAEFIAASRTETPWLVERLRARDAAIRAVVDVLDDPGGPDSWSHTFQGRHAIFADDVRAALASALGGGAE